MVPCVSAEKMFTSGINCVKNDGEVLRMKTGVGGQEK